MIQQKLEKILEYGVYLWIFLLPWQIRYFYQATIKGGAWEGGSTAIYVSEIVLLLLIFGNFVFWIRQPATKNNHQNFTITQPIWWLLIFVAWAFLSAWWSVFPALSIYYGLKLFLGLGVIWLIGWKKISFNRVAVIFVASGLVQGLLAISQFLNQFVWGSKWLGMAWQDPQNLGVSVVDTGIRRWLRAYGSFSHPNILGGYLVISLAFLFYLYEEVNKLWLRFKNKQLQIYKIILLISVLIIFSGLLLSFSRAAWLAAGIGLLLIFVQLLFKKSSVSWQTFASLVLLIIVTCGLWISVYSEPFITRIKAQERLEQLSFTQRVDSYQDAWLSFKQQPWLGTGLGAYTYSLHQQYPERYVWDLQPPHNTFLLILVELGLVGFIIFLIIFLLLIKNIYFQFSNLNLLILLVFLMLFDHWWWSLVSGQYLLYLLGAVLWYKKT